MSQFYTEMHNRGMKNLSESAAPGNWLAVAGSLYPQPPATLSCRGRSTGSSSFSQAAQQKYPANQREQKDAHSTSRLGVSRR